MRSFVIGAMVGLVLASSAMAAFKPVAGQMAAARIVDAVLAYDWAAVRAAAEGLTDASGRDRSAWVLRQIDYLESRNVKERDLDVPQVVTALEVGIPLHNLMIATRELGARDWQKLGRLVERAYAAGLAAEDEDLTLRACHAGLLYELGRSGEADRAFTSPTSPEDMEAIDVINVAYYFAARRDRAQCLTWLKWAMERDENETRDWARLSDDLNAFRDDPEFAAVLR